VPGVSAPFTAGQSSPVCGAGAITGTGADGRQETGHVLKNDPPWAQFAGQPHDLPEQSRACAAQARAAACDREILTGESSGEDSPSGNKSSCPEIIAGHLSHVWELRCLREVPGQDAAAVRVNLNSRDHADAVLAKRPVESAE
jgi:hypothetical protein